MRYFVTGDDAAIANRISTILVQLRQDCPASQVFRLDRAVSALEAATVRTPTAILGGEIESKDVVLVALFPDPERALAVMRDIRRRNMGRMLVVGPTTDTKLVLRAMREGATEYLDQEDLKTELSDALERLEATGSAGRVIAMLAPSGGSGASLLAVNVATVLAQKHSRCALIDLKLATGDLAPLLNLKPNHTLADVCQNIKRLDYSLLQGCLAACESGVQLLAAPARIVEAADVTPEAVEAVLSLIRRHFPFVVLDIDHSFREEQRSALKQADVVVLVLRMDFIALRNARITLDYLKESGVSRDNIRIVANRLGEASQLTASQVDESLAMKISHSIPNDPQAVIRSYNSGIPVVLQSPSAKVSRSLTELAVSLAGPQ